MSPQQDRKWVKNTAKLLGKLGFSEVRTRWRLNQWLDKREGLDRASELSPQARQIPPKVTPNYVNCFYCRALQTEEDTICYQCKKPVTGTLLDRVVGQFKGFHDNFNVMLVLGICYGLGFLRIVTESGGQGAWSPSGMELFQYGAVYAPAVIHHGEWIRLLSAAFLHGGIVHLGFNLLATSIIAPRASGIFGDRKTFVFFVIAAMFGFLATTLFTGSLSVGASGGIMGMLGALAGWGQRDQTPVGIELRNFALIWLAFVTVMGFMLNVDHAAHFGGFIAGAALGYSDAFFSRWQRPLKAWAHAPFIIACILTLLALWRVMFPMYSLL